MTAFDFPQLSLAERGRLMTRIVAPRPIAFVSSLSAAGVGNLAPFSFFTAGGSNPPAVVFSANNDRHGRVKDTVHNIEATGEYVISTVTRAMAERMNRASFEYPDDVDEFDVAPFTRLPSVKVKPPGVAESPLHIECRLIQVVRVGQGPAASNFVIGEVLYVTADDAVCTDGLPDNHKLDQLARLGSDLYVPLVPEALFSLARPKTP
ncbi:MAG: flavin reductase family protein [Gemmatimonadetes bacterium]|nr:flavin reductase family protein [Gemmatimonadota bacterium]MBI3568783.1 flavin reductase family protein [Gemmatimonadota bacterium]